MPYTESEILKFLAIPSHERYAKMFIAESPHKVVVFSTEKVYMYNTEFCYYQEVHIWGKFQRLVSSVLHSVLEPWEDVYAERQAAIISNDALSTDEKKEARAGIKKIQKLIHAAIFNIETASFIKSLSELIASKLMLTPEDHEKLNTCKNCLNFQNGKLNLETNEFTARTPDDFVTEYLKYDFEPQKYIETAQENTDKFKTFIEKNFIITNLETDRITKQEIHEMFNRYINSSYPAASLLTDIKRLQLNYQRGMCSMYNDVSRRGVVVGMKKIDHRALEVDSDDDYFKKYGDKQKDFNDLSCEFEKMRLEFEAYKLRHPETVDIVSTVPEESSTPNTCEIECLSLESLIENAEEGTMTEISKSTIEKLKKKM